MWKVFMDANRIPEPNFYLGSGEARKRNLHPNYLARDRGGTRSVSKKIGEGGRKGCREGGIGDKC